jgi:hypothetical protein
LSREVTRSNLSAIATAFLVSGTLPARDRYCPGPSPDDPVTPAATTGPVLPGPLGVAWR